MEIILRTVSFVNQLSIYGAAADMCKDTGKVSFRSDKACAIERKTEVLIKSVDLLKVQSPLQASEHEQGKLLHYFKDRV